MHCNILKWSKVQNIVQDCVLTSLALPPYVQAALQFTRLFSSAQGGSSAVPVHTSMVCLNWTYNQALLDWMQRQASRLCIVFSSANPGQTALSSTPPQSCLHSLNQITGIQILYRVSFSHWLSPKIVKVWKA